MRLRNRTAAAIAVAAMTITAGGAAGSAIASQTATDTSRTIISEINQNLDDAIDSDSLEEQFAGGGFAGFLASSESGKQCVVLTYEDVITHGCYNDPDTPGSLTMVNELGHIMTVAHIPPNFLDAAKEVADVKGRLLVQHNYRVQHGTKVSLENDAGELFELDIPAYTFEEQVTPPNDEQ